MNPPAPRSRQGLVSSWVAQMVGTVVLCGAVLVLMKAIGNRAASGDADWKHYAMAGILLGSLPALVYLRWYRQILNQDVRLERESGGAPDPGARRLLQRSLVLGGALCEIPMALGAVQLYFGGETRWFFGATLLTIAMRLSYRPFNKAR